MELQENRPDSHLLLRYLSGTATKEEAQTVDAWREADQQHDEEMHEVAMLYDVRRTQEGMKRWNASRAYARVRRQARGRSVRLWTVRAAVAASIIAGVASVALMLYREAQPPSMITVETNAGMRSEIALPDGSTVHLNANTQLRYPAQFKHGKRQVALRGEAWFDVAHDAQRPFTVEAAEGRVQIKVLGTQFNVQAYQAERRVEATLVTGSISFAADGLKQPITMSPGEALTYNIADKAYSLRRVETDAVTAWKDNRLIFRNTPMPDVLRELANFYTVDFDVRDKVIMSYSFTGTFDNRPLFQILDYIRISSDVNYVVSYDSPQNSIKPVIVLNKNRKR